MKGITNENNYKAIADAIRSKNGSEQTYTPSEMAEAIREIAGGEGFNLVSAGLPQEYQDEFNAHYKNGIEYAKHIIQILEGASGSVAGAFLNDVSVVFVPELNLENVTNAANLFNGCINLEQTGKITFDKYMLGNSQLFMNCVRLLKIHLHFKNNFNWHANAIMGCCNLREVYIDDISRLTNSIALVSDNKRVKIFNVAKWTKGNLALQYTQVLLPSSIRYIIQNAISLADGATARTLTLHATAKANWEASEYYQEDLAVLEELGITIA